jgi:hypothetical protein
MEEKDKNKWDMDRERVETEGRNKMNEELRKLQETKDFERFQGSKLI